MRFHALLCRVCVSQDQVGGENIFYCEAQRFEYGDLTVILTGWKFAEFGGDVRCGPAAFGDSHDHVTRFLKRGGPRVDYQAGALYQNGIEFALRRQARSDGNDVGSVSDPPALNHRRRRRRYCDYDIGTPHHCFGVRHSSRSGFSGELAQAVWVGAPCADFGELAL